MISLEKVLKNIQKYPDKYKVVFEYRPRYAMFGSKNYGDIRNPGNKMSQTWFGVIWPINSSNSSWKMSSKFQTSTFEPPREMSSKPSSVSVIFQKN